MIIRSLLSVGLTAGMFMTCVPAALHAEPTLADLAKEIAALKAENRQMKSEIAGLHKDNKQTREKVRQVSVRPAALPPGPVTKGGEYAVIPAGATPLFVTAQKQLIFGALTVTPGGFLAGESVYRSKTTQSDINTSFTAIPLGNNPLSHTDEFKYTGRQSRLSLLAEGQITPSIMASGYAEVDFLGATTNANATDTNSYAPRMRQLYAGADWNDWGLHLTAGQMWSLATLNSKGITNRNEVLPPTIDGQYVPGFIFARQGAIRLAKNFGNGFWAAISAEEAQTTFATSGCSGAAITSGAGTAGSGAAAVTSAVGTVTAVCAATASGGGYSQYGQPYSLNHAPDVIGKIAYEWQLPDRDIHIEGMGLYKDLYDASYPTAGNIGNLSTHDTTGYGFGGGVVIPVIPKYLDFQGSAMAGRGIGRYGASGLADSTFNLDGSLRPIGEIMGMGGFTLHATPAIDLYAFGGIERDGASFANASGTLIGYGLPNALNSGCNTVNAASATCAGQNQAVWQLTGGIWDKVYQGPFGTVRVGLQYSYTQRDLFGTQYSGALVAGSNQTLAQEHAYYAPKAVDNMFLTSIRYYPFQ